MKCTIPEISWHNRDPVLSIDVQPRTNSKDDFYRLASGGTDSHVLVSGAQLYYRHYPVFILTRIFFQIWYMVLDADENNHVKLELAADLSRHQRAVNAVRWSPSGELLASADDESVIFIWKKKDDNETVNILGRRGTAANKLTCN